MKPEIISAVALLASLGTACRRTYNDSTVNVAGNAAEVNTPSPTVLLGDSQGPDCSATLVAPQLVVTASHCVLIGALQSNAPQRGAALPTRSSLRVTFAKKAQQADYTMVRSVAEIRPSPRSIFINPAHGPIDSSSSGASDIAILKLADDAPQGFPTAKLSNMDVKILKNRELKLHGFGYTEMESRDFGTLREGIMNYYLRENSGEFYARGINENHAAACPGDSGGSLYFISAPGAQPVLLGVTSKVIADSGRCAGSNSIFVDVAYHRAWLIQTAKEWGLTLE